MRVPALRDAMTYFIQTPALRAREFRGQDAAALMALHRNARVQSLLIDPYPFDNTQSTDDFLRAMDKIYRSNPGFGIWLGERPATPGEPVCGHASPGWRFFGWMNLLPHRDHPGAGEIGCRLQLDSWGRGLPLKIGEALLQHAFFRLRLPLVVAYCHPQHRSVHLILRTLGFTEQGQRLYCGRSASLFSIEPDQWRLIHTLPLRERRRTALAAAPSCS
jgi:RimJ/RimL family protein N-acetyltransferase